ncbi:multidrug resistance efflux pump [Rhizobium petrolearium]|uniref:HlyD family secretion protein n=2 Tax=Neorhizobium TaxID=1525371 RepID=A0ABV0MD44_9HYPH|nr:HlyD family secretion protein [Neorhizobium petrolearium]MBP1848386.1 multidrug resistance efflux pump [Neorhizobium petrolearium]MCC2614495.1 HlyD family secretion protein [Neorhizobium petrolearium]WGI72256.1 HlyD family secretion protein [Neorhizobium petrolearium]
MSNLFRSIATYVAILVGFAGVFVVLYAWNLPPFHGAVEVTNDAYVRGQVTILSPQLTGYLVEVPVQDYQQIKKGDLIAKIDDRIYAQKLEQAKAALAVAEASLANSEQSRKSAEAKIQSAKAAVESANAALEVARTTYERTEGLFKKNIASKSEAEKNRAAFNQAQAAVHQAEAAELVAEQDLDMIVVSRRSLEANVQSAEAAVKLAEIDLANTRITAPRDGTLGEVTGRIGQYVALGTQIGSIVPNHVWVVANFKETQLAGMQPGQEVTFTVDALGEKTFNGRIERFAPATGSEFSVIKADNATGNFTKVAQRIPVRIAIEPKQPLTAKLVPGMSVVASVDLAQGGAALARTAQAD